MEFFEKKISNDSTIDCDSVQLKWCQALNILASIDPQDTLL